MKTGCFLLVLVCEVFGKENNVDNLVNQNHDQIQEDILSAMKDSGVLKEWKDKLDKLDNMLNDNEIDTEEKLPKTKRKSVLSQQETEMLSSFIDEYISEQKLQVSTDLVLSIVQRVQKTPKPNLPQIFVQLGPVIEVVSALSKKTSDLEKIIDRQGPVFDSPAKTKDVLHTLAENLKSELVRLTLETPPKSGKKSPPPPPPKKEKKELGLEDYLTNFFKSGNANQLLSLLSGSGGDLSTMTSLLPQLLGNGNYKSILSTVVGAYFEGSPYGPLIQQYGSRFLESEQGEMLADGFNSLLENVAVSESGQRFVKLMPQLMATKDLQSLLEVLGEEAEWNWGLFFTNIENTEYRTSFIDSQAENGVKLYNFIQNPPRDSVVSQLPLMINGFLISYRIPAYDSRTPTKSVIAILNKCVRLFTTWKLDTTSLVNQVHQALTESLEKQLKGRKFDKLDSEEKKALISLMIDSELVSPVQTVWDVYTQAASQPQCAEQFMCSLNQREKKSNQGQTRQAVVKGASLAAGWTLSRASQEVYWSLYNAVMAGSKGADCLASYPSKRDTCKLADRQVSVQSAHVEL
eukprot:GFUD01025393.1.p1 GENE.GFUD01025393.1~~GFUD01025393.1.p1  ORF type:complete len:575 (+),score=189.06 GFUD01025393.1:233-1957(+)